MKFSPQFLFELENSSTIKYTVQKYLESKNGKLITSGTEEYIQDIKIILNKISAKTCEAQCEEICAINLNKNNATTLTDKLEKIAEIICEQAFIDSGNNYSELYCNVLKHLSKKYTDLKKLVLQKCAKNVLENYKINVPTDIVSEIDKMDYMTKKKTYYMCCLNFIIKMYIGNYINDDSVRATISHLFRHAEENNYEELYVDYICHIFFQVLKIKVFQSSTDITMIEWIKKLDKIAKYYTQKKLPSKIVFRIHDIFDLCNQKLIDKCFEDV